MTATPEKSAPSGKKNSRARTLLVLGETVMILALLAAWLLSDEIRASKSLVVLFFYSFPSEFLIGLVPHEPVILFYGEHYPALTVAAVAAVSTVLAEGMNYLFFSYVSDSPLFGKMRQKRTVVRIVELFGKAPFIAILVAGFTPVPFFPIRFLVVMGKYPVLKYLLGVFLSRAPRFYILAAAGNIFGIPAWALALLFVVMILTVNVPLVKRLLSRERV